MSICSKCRYAGSANEVGNVECHRYPPVGRENVFPLMRAIDWCGEWERSASLPAEEPVDAECKDGCQYAKDVGMPEYPCAAGHCQYAAMNATRAT